LIPNDGDVSVEVHLESEVRLRPETLRAILVPFAVPAAGKLELSGIYEKVDRLVQIPRGKYSLLFQLGRENITGNARAQVGDGDLFWCWLTFVADDLPRPAILRRDADLKPPEPLVMDGEPA